MTDILSDRLGNFFNLTQTLNLINQQDKTKEVCGVIVNKTLQILPNASTTPTDNFLISTYPTGTTAILHTHYKDTHSRYLTFADILLSLTKNLPIFLYNLHFQSWDYYDPNYTHPYPLTVASGITQKDIAWYYGREYSYGRSDCYSIIYDYYAGMLGKKIERGDRNVTDLINHNVAGWNRFLNELTTLGKWKLKTGKLAVNDLVLLKIKNTTANHCAVVTDLLPHDNAKLLHLYGGKRLSEPLSLKEVIKSVVAIYTYP